MPLRILQGDWVEQLKTLPDQCVHCVVTSPPYWGLRDYGVPDQLGLEPTPEEYVAKLVQGFREVRRVLRDDGTLWLNLGDSYARNGGEPGGGNRELLHMEGTQIRMLKVPDGAGLKPKDLVGIPWMVAFALRADGWYLRQDIIWAKPNPMPESVTDRCTKAHEYIFLLTKSARYFYDAEAIKEPSEYAGDLKFNNGNDGMCEGYDGHRTREGLRRGIVVPATRNKRSVWTVPSQPYPEAHFATFPEDLIKPCILAGTSARGCCPKCGAPWERQLERTFVGSYHDHKLDGVAYGLRQNGKGPANEYTPPKTLGWQPTCDCGFPNTVPCVVCDPFLGSGTSAQVALELGRHAIGIELSPAYILLAQKRCAVTPGLPLA